MRQFTALAALVAALTLTACSAPVKTAPAPVVRVEPTVVAAPIPTQAAASPTASKYANDDGKYTQDEFFLMIANGTWRGTKPTVDQFIAAAYWACDQISRGVEIEDVHNCQKLVR